MAPVIRKGRLGDEAALSKIGGDSFTETFGHLYRAEDLNAFLLKSHAPPVYEKLLRDKRSKVWLVEDNEGAAGYASAGPCDLPVDDMPANAGELQRLYVLKKLQGGGVGTQLLETVLAWLDDHFAHQFLSVYAHNDGAQRLYQRYGFEKVQEYKYMIGTHADPEWIMRRNR